MEDEMAKDAYQKAVDAIIKDMCGRSGGDHWFEGCDEEIQQALRDEWAAILRKYLKP